MYLKSFPSKKKDLGIDKPQTSVYFVACEQIHIDHSTEK